MFLPETVISKSGSTIGYFKRNSLISNYFIDKKDFFDTILPMFCEEETS